MRKQRSSTFLYYFNTDNYVGDFNNCRDSDHIVSATTGAVASGILFELHLKITAKKITGVRYRIYGNSAAIGSAALLAHLIEHQTTHEAKQLTHATIIDMLDLAPVDQYGAVVVVDAMQRALSGECVSL